MRPDHERFLKTWADLAATGETAVAFGGFSLLQAPHDARFAVHRSMAARSDCIPHDQRAFSHPRGRDREVQVDALSRQGQA